MGSFFPGDSSFFPGSDGGAPRTLVEWEDLTGGTVVVPAFGDLTVSAPTLPGATARVNLAGTGAFGEQGWVTAFDLAPLVTPGGDVTVMVRAMGSVSASTVMWMSASVWDGAAPQVAEAGHVVGPGLSTSSSAANAILRDTATWSTSGNLFAGLSPVTRAIYGGTLWFENPPGTSTTRASSHAPYGALQAPAQRVTAAARPFSGTRSLVVFFRGYASTPTSVNVAVVVAPI